MNWTSSFRSGFTRFTRVRLAISTIMRAAADSSRTELRAPSTLGVRPSVSKLLTDPRGMGLPPMLPPACAGCGGRSRGAVKHTDKDIGLLIPVSVPTQHDRIRFVVGNDVVGIDLATTSDVVRSYGAVIRFVTPA